MSAKSTIPVAKSSGQIRTNQEKATDDRRLVRKNADILKSVDKYTCATAFQKSDEAQMTKNPGNCHARRYDQRSAYLYEYQLVQRPWMNIKRAGNETSVVNAYPMERWEGERAGDQPWNVVGGFFYGPSVTSIASQAGSEMTREWNNKHRGSEQISMTCEVSNGESES
jgi:hypothetical protein